eukprot:gb/GECG01002180.1/.p1 GENE.gb/GECG01002180.1/~~gb/GECG01002180.1/.p1  ORF type:complete len:470 (+),score=33.69 gb/GECG01002180.1/:1-1410(+)
MPSPVSSSGPSTGNGGATTQLSQAQGARSKHSRIFAMMSTTPSSSQGNPAQLQLWHRSMSASFGAVLVSLFTTPLDVVRVRMQSSGTVSDSALRSPKNSTAKRKMLTNGEAGLYYNSSPFSSVYGRRYFACERLVAHSHCVKKAFDRTVHRPRNLLELRQFFSTFKYHPCMNAFHPKSTLAFEAALLGPATSAYKPHKIGSKLSPDIRKSLTSPRPKALSALKTLQSVVRKEGIRSLWSGLSPSLVMAVPSTTLYFTAYDELKLTMEGYTQGSHLEQYIPLIAGSTARTAAAAVTSPLELVRTQMQSRKLDRGIIQSFQHEIGSNGYMSLWRGLVPTLYRDVPFSGLYWFSYEKIKRHLRTPLLPPKDNTTFFDEWKLAFLSGSLAGSSAAIVTTPFDVVKTRRQAVLTDKPLSKASSSTIALLQQIVKKEGISALFSGLLPRLLKVSPACAIMISSYELGKMVFANQQ